MIARETCMIMTTFFSYTYATAALRGPARDCDVDGGVGGARQPPGRGARGAVREEKTRPPLHHPTHTAQHEFNQPTHTAPPLFRLVDAPGHPRLRGLWTARVRARGGLRGVVLVVDSADFGTAGVREAAE